MSADTPHVVLIDGRLYSYGFTRAAAWHAFQQQTKGVSAATRRRVEQRATCQPIDDDQASEVAEMLAADIIEWENT